MGSSYKRARADGDDICMIISQMFNSSRDYPITRKEMLTLVGLRNSTARARSGMLITTSVPAGQPGFTNRMCTVHPKKNIYRKYLVWCSFHHRLKVNTNQGDWIDVVNTGTLNTWHIVVINILISFIVSPLETVQLDTITKKDTTLY